MSTRNPNPETTLLDFTNAAVRRQMDDDTVSVVSLRPRQMDVRTTSVVSRSPREMDNDTITAVVRTPRQLNEDTTSVVIRTPNQMGEETMSVVTPRPRDMDADTTSVVIRMSDRMNEENTSTDTPRPREMDTDTTSVVQKDYPLSTAFRTPLDDRDTSDMTAFELTAPQIQDVEAIAKEANSEKLADLFERIEIVSESADIIGQHNRNVLHSDNRTLEERGGTTIHELITPFMFNSYRDISHTATELPLTDEELRLLEQAESKADNTLPTKVRDAAPNTTRKVFA